MFLRPLFILLCPLALVTASAQEGARPNLLLIVADDMGYGDLGSYGSNQVPTPNLDRLAERSALCTDGYVSGSVCSPSRAGLMTGRNGSRFGYEHNLSREDYLKSDFTGIPLDEPLIADRLADLGYRTGIVGKWHLGDSVPEQHPNARGFEFFFGMLGGSHNYWPTLDKNQLLYGHEKPTEIRTPYLTDWFTLEALDFIHAENHAATDNSDRPWFLYLSYNTPHAPMQAKDEDLAQFADITPKARQAYCAMQLCMDRNIGLILDDLEQGGELDNTLIVFISDNGGSVEVSHAINAPLRGTKGTFLEGGVRVPTIWSWRGHIEPQVYEGMVSSLDIAASFVVAAGGEFPEGSATEARGNRSEKNQPIYDGVNLLPFFAGEAEGVPHDRLYWRSALRGSAMREGKWKLLRPNNQPVQLYNLAEDISEQHDLSAEEPERLQQMLDAFVDWEITLERNPMFMSAPFWSGYNRNLYNAEYQLEQP